MRGLVIFLFTCFLAATSASVLHKRDECQNLDSLDTPNLPPARMDIMGFMEPPHDIGWERLQDKKGCDNPDDLSKDCLQSIDASPTSIVPDRRWFFDKSCNAQREDLKQGVKDMFDIIRAMVEDQELLRQDALIDYWMGDTRRPLPWAEEAIRGNNAPLLFENSLGLTCSQ